MKDVSLKGIPYQVSWLVINSIWNRDLRLMSGWEKEGKERKGEHEKRQ